MNNSKYFTRVRNLSEEQRRRLAARLAARDAVEGKSGHLTAYIVPGAGWNHSELEVREALQKKLPDHMVPSSFVFVDALPTLPNGKVDRKALVSLKGKQPATTGAFVAPRNETEEKVARIWQAVLNAEKVGINDNFFHLGGHSLLALQVISRLRDAFQTELPLRRIFETPTVAGLAEALEQCQRNGVVPPIRRVSASPNAQPVLDSRSRSPVPVALEEPRRDEE